MLVTWRIIATQLIQAHLFAAWVCGRFRRVSMNSAVCKGTVVGFGLFSYELGLRGLVDIIKS